MGKLHRKWVSLLTHVHDRTQLSVCSRSLRCFFPTFRCNYADTKSGGEVRNLRLFLLRPAILPPRAVFRAFKEKLPVVARHKWCFSKATMREEEKTCVLQPQWDKQEEVHWGSNTWK